MDSNETYTPMKEPKYCFVPGCKNNSRDTQKAFFAVPSSAKQEWCNAVGISCPKRVIYICEDHLNLLPLHQDKLKMALADQTEIKFCRVCLAVDVKMYDMKEYRLSEMFQNITGIPACDETERVLCVCWECAARLTAASAFRDKALLADTLLKDLVHKKKRDIEQLRQHHSYLKSPLTVQTVFTSAEIECVDTPIGLHSDESEKRKVYKRRTKRKSNEVEEEGTVFDEEDPVVEFSVQTEIESDPFAENNINIQIKDENSLTYSEVTNFDDSVTPCKDDYDDEIRNTEQHINEKSDDIEMMATPITYGINLLEDNVEKQPTIDAIDKVFDEPSSKGTEMTNRPNEDKDIVLEDDNVEENPMLDGIGNISEDRLSLAELVSAKKTKKQTSKKVGASSKRLNDGEKLKIIALKEKGLSLREIVRQTGKSRNTVRLWLRRFKETGNIQKYRPGPKPIKYTPVSERHQVIVRRHTEHPFLPTQSTAMLCNVSVQTVRKHLHVAGLKQYKPIQDVKFN